MKKDSFIYSLIDGITRMRTKRAWIGFGISVLVSVLNYNLKPFLSIEVMPLLIRYFFWILFLLAPLWYLVGLGSSGGGRDKFRESFIDIGMVDKRGRTPFLINQAKDNKKNIYTFFSKFPFSRWHEEREKLESQWNCTIVHLQEIDKQRTKLTTIPGKLMIPDRVDWNNSYLNTENDYILTLGIGQLGPITVDLNIEPHFFIAGSSNCGKSGVMRCSVAQCIAMGWEIRLIDLKGGIEFNAIYERFSKVAKDHDSAIKILTHLIDEIESRAALLSERGAKNLTEYNRKTGSGLQRIGVFIDEAGQLLDKGGVKKEITVLLRDQLSDLARRARAVGIHLFLGIQLPNAKIIDGQIKSNITGRICGYFPDRQSSDIVLGTPDARYLPKKPGRFLIQSEGEIMPFQAFYFEDEWVDDVLDAAGITKYQYQQKAIKRNEPELEPITAIPVEKKKVVKLNFDFLKGDESEDGIKEREGSKGI